MKKNIGTHVFLPMPVVLVGTMAEGKPNFATVAWAGRVSMKPPLLTATLNKRHHTHAGILASGVFSVNVPPAELMEAADYCGIVSGRQADKGALFTVFQGETGAPLIEECRLCLECRLYQTVDLPAHSIFLGEIVASWADEEALVDDVPDPARLDPLLLTMPDNGYWRLGERAGQAWSVGKAFKRSEGR